METFPLADRWNDVRDAASPFIILIVSVSYFRFPNPIREIK